MAFFGGSKNETKAFEASTPSAPAAPKTGAATITGCMEILGSVKGCGSIHIDGKIHGDLSVDDQVVIGKEGMINGDVHAKKVIVSGKIHGNVNCEVLEVTQTGHLTQTIMADKIVSDGKIEATISECDTIHITKNGQVTTKKMVGKHIVVNGSIEGNVIATELLEINQDGRVKGEMQVRKIKVSEGGLMLGTMLTYEPTNPVRTVEKKELQEKKPSEASAMPKNEQATALKEIVKTKEK
jgi:cytoskeletal protein CcmA (bactofilin family)